MPNKQHQKTQACQLRKSFKNYLEILAMTYKDKKK